MGENLVGSDDDINVLFDRVSNKLGWKSDADLDDLFEQLSQSTKKKKNKRPFASGKKKKKSKTLTRKKTQDLPSEQRKQSGTPSCSGRNGNPSFQRSRDSPSSEAGISNEISRNLNLEFLGDKSSSAGISIAKKEEDKTVEVLRNTAPVASPENKRDCVAPTSFHSDSCRTQLELDECHLNDELENAYMHIIGSEEDMLEKFKDEAFQNKVNIQTPNEAHFISGRTLSSDEDVVQSDKKLSKSCNNVLNNSRGAVFSVEDDIAKVITKEFTESPQPMQWLMSPPSLKPRPSKLSPLPTLNSDSSDNDPNADSNENDTDVGDILGANFPSLSERLARNHFENRKKESANRKNRRRSCANPRSAPFVLDGEWEEHQEKNGQEGEDEDRLCDGETRLEAEDDGEEERTASGRDEEEMTNVSKGFEDQERNAELEMKDRQILNTKADSFRKARTRYQDSSSDDDFESFLNAVKTPKYPKQQSGQTDSDEAVYVVDDDDFIDDTPLESRSDDDDDNDVFYLKVNNLDNPLNSGKRTTKKHPTVGSRSGSILSQLLSSSDDDDGDDIFVIPNPTPSVRKPNSKVSSLTVSSKKTPARQRRPLQPTTLPSNRCFSTPSRTEQPAPVSFLASLSTPGKGMSTRSRYVSDFKRNKDELTQKLFKLYNESVFENKLPSDFSITWNNRMRKTAGFCFYKKRLGERTARIELSVKVCDTAERLRDTLIHELCHAAAWLIHGVSDGHGKFWKYWAAKANLAHPEIPIIKRCHTYEINTKYKYKCVQCGNIIGRHSKSVDTKRFCCAYCNGRLELQPTLRKDGTPARARGPNPFAAFVKENYASLKKTHGAAKHAEVMKLLSQEFASKTKITNS